MPIDIKIIAQYAVASISTQNCAFIGCWVPRQCLQIIKILVQGHCHGQEMRNDHAHLRRNQSVQLLRFQCEIAHARVVGYPGNVDR